MNQMKSLSSVMSKALSAAAGSDALVKKAARAAQVKRMWRESVDAIFLEHTNSVYIIREDERKILIVYVDDSIFAAEPQRTPRNDCSAHRNEVRRTHRRIPHPHFAWPLQEKLPLPRRIERNRAAD